MNKTFKRVLEVIQKRNLFSFGVILLALFMVVSGSIRKNAWNEDVIVQNDVIFYYEYLPAVWIYHDMSFSFLDNKEDESINRNKFWAVKNEEGKRFSKMTAGESVLLSPFFLVAHQVAKFNNEVANGYSPTYYLSIVIAAWFYFFLALLFLRSVLLHLKLNDLIVGLSLLTLTVGTNLIYYASIEVGMSHIYSFFLFSGALWATIKWHIMPKWWNSIVLGTFLGLIIITRIPNVIFLIIPLVYGISSKESFWNKLKLLRKNWPKLISVVFSLLTITLIQPILWYWGTGHWFVYSYSDEGFFFSDPRIIDSLFSFRKGLLIYSPALIFGITGLFILRKKARDLVVPLTIFLLINVYLLSSWWCWWFGGGFGNRAYIESYALLLIPLALTLEWIKNKLSEITLFALIGLVISYNFFLLDKYLRDVIHYDGMTKDAFFAIFNDDYQKGSYWDKMNYPSYANRVIGGDEREPLVDVLTEFSDSTIENKDFPLTVYSASGNEYFTLKYGTKLRLTGEFVMPKFIDSTQELSILFEVIDPRFNKSWQSEEIRYSMGGFEQGQLCTINRIVDTPRIWGEQIEVKLIIKNTTSQPIRFRSFKAEKLIY